MRKTSKSTLCDRCIQEGYTPEDVPVKPNSGLESDELDTCTACRRLATELVDEVGDRLCGRCRAVFRAARALFKEGVADEMEIVPTLAFAAHAGARWALVNEKLPEYFREVRPETATDYEPVPPGLYTATLEKIEEATSAHGTYYRWQFDIEDEGEQENRRVFANVSDKFGPQSKARRWCEQMIGRAIRKGEQFDTDALLGQSYHIMVSNTPEDERGRVYDNVENVHAIRSKVNPKPQKVEETDDAEKGFDGIPW